MKLLIVLNILLLLFLIGTYLSLSGRVKHLEKAIRRQFLEMKDPADGISGREERTAEDADVEDSQEEGAGEAGVRDNNASGDQAGQEQVGKEQVGKEQVGKEQAGTDLLRPATFPVLAEPVPRPTGIARMLRPRTREEWEILIGGRLMNRVGALALILGVGFFLKYAFDNDWLNELARALMGGAAGLALIAVGHRFHLRNLAVFSQGLTGAGVAILYLSIYAAYDFYHLIPHPAAFFLMALVTVAALLLSLRYNGRAIALLGWAGGFLTPFLLVTAELNTFGLFVYITLLDAGLIVILLNRRRWRLLEPLGIAATYGTYLTWSFRADLPEGFVIALVFLTLWWALFVGMDLYRSFTEDPGNRRWRWTAGAINIIGYFMMLVSLFRHAEEGWSYFGILFSVSGYAWNYSVVAATVILSLAYFALATVIARRTEDSQSVAFYAATAVVLAVLAPVLYFERYAIMVAWGIEAFTLFWYGVRFQRPIVRHTGSALFLLSIVGLYVVTERQVIGVIMDNQWMGDVRTAAYWVLAGALLACTGMMRGRLESTADRRLWMVFHVAWTALLLIWGTLETREYFDHLISTTEGGTPEQLENLRHLAVSGVWLIGATLVMIMGRWLDIRALRAAAIVYLGCTVLKVFISDLMFLDTLYRIFAFLGLSVILIAVSYLYYRNRPAS